jgi:hypothetical protein
MFGLNGKEYVNGKAKADVTAPALAVEPSRQLQVADNNQGSSELARFMPVMDIAQAVARRDLIVQAMKQLMVDGVDYGKIPNCGDKPALLQPGADKLCNLFGLTLKYDFLEKTEDWSGAQHGGEPFFYYQIRTQVFRGDFLIAEGVGACHSWESKYRWRKAERTCPQCGKANIRKSREGGWYCWKKTDGCGSVFNDGDPAIEGQETGRKPNPDVFDSVNTILKMAYKRCKIHGTINGTSASEFFTQDIEDFSVSDDIDTGGFRPGTSQAAQYVAQQKIATGNVHSKAPWKTMREMAECFKQMRTKVGEVIWLGELERYGWHSFQDLRNSIDNRTPNAKEKATECYWHLEAIARKEVA